MCYFGQLMAQHLAFTRPQRILPAALSDDAPGLFSFDHQSVSA
ncbi:hypothetical protein [Spirosoma flavum]|uniref:Uncharacterized protein n=1 Tax=Spirosoma flavum TaxID=2048557 RepID=A0ABW6AI75_9BACT